MRLGFNWSVALLLPIALIASDRPEDLAKIISDQIINRFLKVSDKDQQFIGSISPIATLPKYLTEIQKSL